MPEQHDDLFQSVEDLVAGGLGVLDQATSVGDLSACSRLTFAEDVYWQGIDHVGVDEFLLVTFQLGKSALLVCDKTAA